MDTQERLEDHEIRILDLERTPIDLLKLLRGERVKVKFPRRYVAMWVTSVTVGIFRETAFTLLERIKILFEGEIDMGFDLLLASIRPKFMIILLFLWVVGIILKKLVPKLNNKYIPHVLLGLSFVSCSVLGFGSSEYLAIGGSPLWIDTFVYCGLFHGVTLAFFAFGGWDFIHGVTKKGGTK